MVATSHTLLRKFKLIKIINNRFLVSRSHQPHSKYSMSSDTEHFYHCRQFSCALLSGAVKVMAYSRLPTYFTSERTDRSPSEHWDLRCWRWLLGEWECRMRTGSPESWTSKDKPWRQTHQKSEWDRVGVFLNIVTVKEYNWEFLKLDLSELGKPKWLSFHKLTKENYLHHNMQIKLYHTVGPWIMLA